MRYKITISYDGSYFHGFQRQNKYISVQQVLEEKISEILKTDVIIKGAGRTDAGVHAKGQVAHFDSTQFVPPTNLKKIINKKVYPHIYVTDVEIVDETFHSRINAKKKEYRYYVSLNTFDPLKANYMHFFHDRIDIAKIREAMKYIEGTHDFTSFVSSEDERENKVRTIFKTNIKEKNGIIEITFQADGFMKYQVRNMVGLLLYVGSGKKEVKEVPNIIDAKDRTKSVKTAPPEGLYLKKVWY